MGMKYHPIINKVAASTFGVLMIHANSDTMRQWLWRDVLQNTSAFHSSFFVIHAFCSVLAVYCICTVLDMVRITVLEKPLFRWYDRRKLEWMKILGKMDKWVDKDSFYRFSFVSVLLFMIWRARCYWHTRKISYNANEDRHCIIGMHIRMENDT